MDRDIEKRQMDGWMDEGREHKGRNGMEGKERVPTCVVYAVATPNEPSNKRGELKERR